MAIYSENKFSPLQRLTKPATYDMFTDVIISTGCPPPHSPFSPFTHKLTVISTGCLPQTLFTHRLALSPPSTPVQSQTDWPPPTPQFTHRLIGKVCDDVNCIKFTCLFFWPGSSSASTIPEKESKENCETEHVSVMNLLLSTSQVVVKT